jgi:hypothetical protein
MIFSLIFLTVWFLLTGSTDAHAGFVAPLFMAISSAIGGLGVVGQFLLGTAIKIGLSLISKAMKEEPRDPGVKTQIQVGGDSPLSFVMGRFASGGHLEYANTWGNAGKTPNAYLTHAISLSDLTLGAITGLWIGDKKVTLPDMSGTAPYDQGWAIPEFVTDGSNNHSWLRFYRGDQTTASSFLISKFGSDPDRPWSSDMIGRGIGYATVTAQYEPKLFAGVPAYLFETNGIPLYDVRKDSTAGGSGSHRRGQQATYEPSNNPAVMIYNILIGIYYEGEKVWGGDCEPWQLPAANWMAAMNACDEAISLVGGGTEPRYRAGCEITVDMEPADVIETLLKGCSGRIAEVGGIFKMAVGAPGAAVYSFTDETIIVTEGQSFDPFPGLAETVNGAQASYPEPAEKWASKDAPAYLRADLEPLDDNRRLVTGIQFPTVPYAVQVQRLLKEIVEDSRRFRVHQFYLPPEASILEPNDVVAWTSNHNSYSNKKFIIIDIEEASNLLQLVTLKEVDPNDFTWNPLTDQKPYSVGAIGPLIPPAQIMTGFEVFPATFNDTAGNQRRPSIGVRFPGDLDDVQFTHVQVRLASNQSGAFDGVLPYGVKGADGGVKEIVLNGTFLPSTAYEARGIFEPFSRRRTEWSLWLPVTTDDIRLGDGDIYPIDLDQLAEDVREYQKWIGDSVREIIADAQQFALRTADQDAANYSDKQQLRTELVSKTGEITAAYTDAITVATGPSSALAQRLTTLEATIPNLATATALSALTTRVTATEGDITAISSSLTSLTATVNGKASASSVSLLQAQVSVIDGQVTANADAITALTTTVNGVSANATFRMGTGYTPAAGWTSRIGLEARISAAATFRAAGIFLDATASQSRVVLTADQVVMTDGVNIKAPFLFTGGVLYVNEMVVDWAKITNVTISSAQIGNLTVQTSNLDFSAVTDKDNISGSSTNTATYGSWVTITSKVISNPNPNPVFCQVIARARAVSTSGGGSAAGTTTRWINTTTGEVLGTVGAASVAGSVADNSIDQFYLDQSPVSAGGYTYALQRQHTTSGGTLSTCINSGELKMIWWKR